MDTLYLAGLTSRFDAARAWVVDFLNVSSNVEVNVFETTIRVLGGLLSTHHLRGGDAPLLAKARALGANLAAAFASPTGLPYSDVNLATRQAHGPAWGPDSSVSEVSTLTLEFGDLADALGDASLAAPAARAQAAVARLAAASDGLAAAKFISPEAGVWGGSHVITLGARVDSFYEYLLKGWLQSGKKDKLLLHAYQDAVHGVTTRLLARSRVERLLFVGEREGASLVPKMDHLVCFYPGLLALGHAHGVAPRPEQARSQSEALSRLGFGANATQLDVAMALAATCRETYVRNPLGMGPEIAHFNLDDARAHNDVLIKPLDAHSLLRPEHVESLFVLWRITRQQRFRDWGWEVATAIERHARVPTGGYASVDSVLDASAPKRDSMESFFLGETLKYLHLLFEDEQSLSLTEWVLNTEAHPLPLRSG